MRRATTLRALCCLWTFWLATAARADVIYQGFEERFSVLETKLDRLAALGYTHLQVSPPQKSIDLPIWWARYQPLDLDVLEGPLGNEAELGHLIDAAHAKGLKVLVDVVLNHMADPSYNGGTLDYPQFTASDFHDPEHHPCITDWKNRYQVTHYYICDAGKYLPDLDTSSEHVRSVHKRFLQKLLDLGADGFRFDAAKHIEPEYFKDLVQSLPRGNIYYGEVIGETLAESKEYTPYIAVTDFHLLGTMLATFKPGGDLHSLIDPGAFGGALPGESAVVFARNHDTAMHADFFNFSDYQDALLATAFVVGRGVGTAFVYRDDYDQPLVAEAVKFHRLMSGKSTYVRRAEEICSAGCDARTLLVVERGNAGAMILNSANAWVDAPAAKMPGLEPGCYKELASNLKVAVGVGGDGQRWISRWDSPARGGLRIGPRTALFLAKTSQSECN